MKRTKNFMTMLIIIVICQLSFGQGQSQQFKMAGINPETILLDQIFTESAEISPFNQNINKVFGISVSADIKFTDESSSVKLILVDKNFKEYLIYESNYLLVDEIGEFSIDEVCEETSVLDNVKVHSVKIEIVSATIKLKSLTYTRAIGIGINIDKVKKEKKQEQNKAKIIQINKKLKERGMNWVAGPTEVSELTYEQRKKLYGQSTFPAGFEFYAGGVISTETAEEFLKSATTTGMYVDNWDWRNRHGKNWITPITNQGSCGSCWAFAATGATEAMVNLFFNQQLNLDLSEQDVLSCSGGGDCVGGIPGTALNYIANNGIVDEAAFPYSETDQLCTNKSTNPDQRIKIGGRIDFGLSAYPKTEDDLKRMLIQLGPVSSGLYDWSHAMVLVGYMVVKEGDIFYYRDLSLARSWKIVAAGDPLIGKTVWIYKNSWGPLFGDEGYVYVETPITNIGWTHAIKTPVISTIKTYNVICEDRDGDGYFWWGLGPKPATCNGPDTPDGNDTDPTLGPLDEYGNCTVIDNTPVVVISADKTIVNKDGTINFTDLSTNNPTSWSWSFPGGNPSTSILKTQMVKYSSTGNYNVTLTVTNSNGTSTKTFTNFISVIEPVIQPVAEFSSDKNTFIAGELVSFTDQSNNNPTSWLWTFEGGIPATSTLQNPKVTYNMPGTYSVSLEVNNSAGSDLILVNDFIKVNDFISDYCTSSGTSSYEWIAVVKVGIQSNYSATSGTFGYEDFTGKVFTAIAGTSQNILLSPKFSGAGKKEFWNIWIDYNGDKDFNDANEMVFSSSASSKDVSGSFTIPPEISITTRMRVSMKRSSSASQCEIFTQGEVEDYTISINEPVPLPPVAEFTATKTNILVDENVEFTDLSENEPTQWDWSFPGGNPSTSNERNPVVTYANVGEYDVSLTVSKPGFDPVKKVKQKYIVTAENSISGYCVPLGINSSFDFIQNVTIGNVLNNSSGGNGYSIFSNQVTMSAGRSYSVTLNPANSANRNFWQLWVDFNGDGDFQDSGENLVSLNNKRGSISTNIIIPQNVTGSTRMRIAMQNSAAPAPCDDNYKGEVEDYTVVFEPSVSLGNKLMTSNLESEISLCKIYPNPVDHFVNIGLNSVAPGDYYTIYNMKGEEMISGEIKTSLTKVDLEKYPPGIYMIVVVNRKRVFNEKILKK